MYHDKRFQKDETFTLLSFCHAQVKAASSASFLLADKEKFHDISMRLSNINTLVLKNLASRMASGEAVKPDTEEERQCFQLINDLDHINGRVQGSITSKKWMRNELWSLIARRGAPSWYITLNPADVRHPICLYFAGNGTTFEPSLKLTDSDRLRLIANNPVAAARFFNFMIQNFIQYVLG